ncbi:MAG: helix-turn-helix transcriptional regulator [Firmicutes bacterium]|nr:helix-turn-helix transcriptional regulator [Bacillota bacterium]
MRKQFRKAMIRYFRIALLQERANKTQEEMAEILDISIRAYQKLEAGITSCSIYTFWRFWVYVCTDRKAFLSGFFHVMDSIDEAA